MTHQGQRWMWLGSLDAGEPPGVVGVLEHQVVGERQRGGQQRDGEVARGLHRAAAAEQLARDSERFPAGFDIYEEPAPRCAD